MEPSDDDEYYMQRMADILDAFPKSGPPKHPVRLSDHLYIGNQDNADDLDLLSALGITHVLNMAGTRNFDLTRYMQWHYDIAPLGFVARTLHSACSFTLDENNIQHNFLVS